MPVTTFGSPFFQLQTSVYWILLSKRMNVFKKTIEEIDKGGSSDGY